MVEKYFAKKNRLDIICMLIFLMRRENVIPGGSVGALVTCKRQWLITVFVAVVKQFAFCGVLRIAFLALEIELFIMSFHMYTETT